MNFDKLINEVGKELFDQMSLGFLDMKNSQEVLDTAANLVRERVAGKADIPHDHALDDFSMVVGASLQAAKFALSVAMRDEG